MTVSAGGIILNPPKPPPGNLGEFLAQYLTGARVHGRRFERAERVTAEWLTAAEAGSEPPPLSGLDGETLYAVGELIDEVYAHTREFPPSHGVVFRARQDYARRVEIVQPRRGIGEPGGLRPLPAGRERTAGSFHLQLAGLPPDDVATRLLALAGTAQVAARFISQLATVARTGSGEVDATALDPAGRYMVTALLQAGARAVQAAGQDGQAMVVPPQLLASWQAWMAQ